ARRHRRDLAPADGWPRELSAAAARGALVAVRWPRELSAAAARGELFTVRWPRELSAAAARGELFTVRWPRELSARGAARRSGHRGRLGRGALDRRVDLGPNQERDAAQIEPEHQEDDATDRAVRRVVV